MIEIGARSFFGANRQSPGSGPGKGFRAPRAVRYRNARSRRFCRESNGSSAANKTSEFGPVTNVGWVKGAALPDMSARGRLPMTAEMSLTPQRSLLWARKRKLAGRGLPHQFGQFGKTYRSLHCIREEGRGFFGNWRVFGAALLILQSSRALLESGTRFFWCLRAVR